MSYSIEYNPELKNRYPARSSYLQKKPILRILLVLVSVLTLYILIAGDFYQLFLPGNPDVTAAALFEMVNKISAGQSVQEAMVCFFHDVIANGVPG